MKRTALLMNVATIAFANAGKMPPVPAPAPDAPAADKPAKTPVTVTTVAALPQPERASKRGSASQFPFASLTAPGMAFGVKGRTAEKLRQTISSQNRRNMKDETDANGQVIYKTTETTDANGNKMNISTGEPKRVPAKKFYAIDVTPEYRAANLADKPEFADVDVLIFREI